MRDPHRRRLFRFPWRSAERIADEIDDEVAFHLAMRERELRDGGLSAEQARAAARDRFGDIEEMTRYCRALDTRTERTRRARERLDALAYDVRYALRQLRRAPAFTVTAVITLALGIGANVAIMSVVYRMLLAPLPFPDGDRLVSLVRMLGEQELTVTPTPQILDAVRARSRSLAWLAAYDEQEVAMGRGADAELLTGVRVEPDLMQRLALPPALGRGFVADDAVPNGPPVVMLGYGVWRGRFGGDPGVLGSTVPIDGVPHTVVGVVARDFDVLSFGSWIGGELWRPLAVTPDQIGITILAGLRPGVTVAAANAEMAAIGASIDGDADDRRFTLQLMPAKADTPDTTRRTLLLLMGAVSVVLLIACANVASLLLTRAAGREREIAVRIALGAGRRRLIRQMLTESLLLAVLGGAAGLLVARYGLRALVAVRPDSLADLAAVRLEPVVLAWCVAVSLLCGLLFGLAPAMIGAHRVDAALKGSRGATGSRRSRRTRAVLVTAEIALSVTLLIAAGVLVRSVRSMQARDLGFEPAGLVSVRVRLPDDRYATREARAAAFDRILERVGTIPGIGDLTIAGGVPPNAGAMFGALQVEGRTAGDEPPGVVGFNTVRPEFFRLLGIAIREGTTFGPDTAGVAIINETMAARLWPGESAVGRRMRVGDRGSFLTVVGVAADVRGPGRASGLELQLYRPFSGSFGNARIVVRPVRAMENLLGQVMEAVAVIDPAITVREAQTLEAALARDLATERFTTRLLSGFALLALALSAVGLYGVVSYGVAQRTRELGMRMALGAGHRDVLAMVVRQGLRLAVIGVAIGFAGAVAATRTMQSLLFEVSPLDPATFGSVGALIIAVSLVATWLPARRASRVDPIAALRSD